MSQQICRLHYLTHTLFHILTKYMKTSNSTVKKLPAIAGSDHNALQVHIQLPLASSKTRFRRYVDYDKLKQVISQVS